MRIGAVMPGQSPPRLAHNLDEVADFGKLPRRIGGATGVEDGGVDGVAKLCLGGEIPLRGKRYCCYAAGNMESPV
ncbi:hypothetical protein N7537_001968 [Penicillium hordei]|uniref:Uncharacterized protein n=1 Tax=Penicillium hordei TaxID=40994 RepID=A0AAD6EHP6_9EURO|nr:uncharacterized protein N7537_001968 [Penicillium hordei]KAJ5616854.1 hypothetical protein N7537_001968 [Penicillium hordei]